MKENSINELPKNWVQTQLGEIVQPSKEKINPLNTEELRYVGLEHIEKDTGQLLGYGSSREVKSTKSKFGNGDLLYGKLRPYLNKVHLVDFEGICSTDILVFNKQPFIANQFLGLRFLSKDFVEYANHNVNGVQHPRVSFDTLSQFKISLPPLNEQKRIVTKIEALQTRSSAVKEELSAIKPLLDQFRQSVLAAAFRGDLTKDWRAQNPDVETNKTRLQSPIVIGEGEGIIPDTWKWSLLTEIAKLESGHTPRKSVLEYWEDGDVPWICLKDIRAAHGKVIENTLHMPTMLGIENSSARLLPKGTVCFSRDISVGFVTIMGRSMATTQHFANWICNNQLFNKYLMYAFMASRYSLIQSGEGTTVRTIYMPALKKMRVVLAPLEEQKEIVRRIESLFKLADSIEQQYQQAEVDLATLNQSILAKAFRGELVPQDPNDEPASVLLEKIKEERDRAKKSKTKKKNSKKKDKQLGIPGM